jgi:hypothetical protein
MQEDKSQSFNLADYIKQQHQEYLKPKEAQENDDIPFFAPPEPKADNENGKRDIVAKNRKAQLNKGEADAGA